MDANLYVAVVQERQEFVFVDNFLGDKIEGGAHVLGIFHWGIQVEIIEVGKKAAGLGF